MSKIVVKSKTQQVYDILYEQIVTNILPPNSPIIIDQVARDLGVSHIPVREAIQQLEAEGFLHSQPFTSTVVAEIKPVFIFETFKTLETLEITSTQMACQSLKDEQIEEIRAILTEMDAALAEADRWSALNEDLHLKIANNSGSTMLVNLLTLMLKHWDRLRRFYFKDVFAHRIEIAHREHWEMFEALQQRDPEKIASVITRHNQDALLAYLSFLKEAPEGEPMIAYISKIVEQENSK